MAKVKSATSTNASKPRRKAITIEGRENQMIALAVDLAEQQLREGTASSQHLKLGSTRERLERERLEEENKLLKARTEALQSQKNMEELYANAIKAMQRYGGRGDSDDENY